MEIIHKIATAVVVIEVEMEKLLGVLVMMGQI
jgi:hypothetical protein